ncbi:hypothetical protein EELLY_v1c04110 [Entomoplasma ellychniae]|uniref:Uncharacterized protein n=1 Tax=Entomoplasma ellychniae TaxID=2114 RepID=A0A8E2QW16_9MOLU|nr:hypothetical protein [Entomoplasma ellychniae]PPE04731.1 hypothetical protein EELLY_v1c04110 [Entomoplasma ellychniae]
MKISLLKKWNKASLHLSLKKTWVSKFNLFWFPITTVIIIISSYFLIGFKDTNAIGLMLFFIIGILSLGVYEIVNLDALFCEDFNKGIMNLERRKGSNYLEIFFNRLIANKTLTISYLFILSIIMLIVCSIKIPYEMNNYPFIVFVLLPIDFLITAVFLFVFAFLKNKITLSVSSLFFILCLFLPLFGMGSVLLIPKELRTSPTLPDTTSLYVEYDTDQAFKAGIEKDSLAERILNEGFHSNQILNKKFIGEDQTIAKKTGFDKYSFFIIKNGIYDIKTINKVFSEDDDEKETLEINDEFKDTMMYKINERIYEKKHLFESLSTDYKNSLNVIEVVNKNNFSFLLKEIEKVSKIIENEFFNSESQKWNEIIINFAKRVLINNSTFPLNSSPKFYTQNISRQLEIWDNRDWNNKLNDYAQKGEVQIPVGLQAWNQLSNLIAINTLMKTKPNDFEKDEISSIKKYIYVLPGILIYSSIVSPNFFVDDWQKIKNFENFFYYWIFANYSVNSNFINSSEEESNQILEFKPLQIVPNLNKSIIKNFYNPVVYQLVLILISATVIGFGFWIFTRRLIR